MEEKTQTKEENDVKERLRKLIHKDFIEQELEIKDVCEICGGSYPHLHHESESFKNKYKWLCSECHKKEHGYS
jgi:hypothetical protein